MPELPEVEVTRRGLSPHLAGQTITGVVVREPRLRWPVLRDVARAGRAHRQVHPAPRQIPAGRLRRRAPHPAPGHVGKPAPRPAGNARGQARPCRPRSLRARSSGVHDPRRFGAVLDLAPLKEHPLPSTRHRAPDARAQPGKAARPVARASHRGQAIPDGRTARRRRRQHLREREPVPRADQSAQAGQPRHAGAMQETGRGDQAHPERGDPRRRLEPRDFVAVNGQSGYFQNRYWVYGREGKA